MPKTPVNAGTLDARAAVLRGSLGFGRLCRLQRRSKFAPTAHDLWADADADADAGSDAGSALPLPTQRTQRLRPTDYEASSLRP